MAEKHSIYDCPYCGKKSFNPLTKALAGIFPEVPAH